MDIETSWRPKAKVFEITYPGLQGGRFHKNLNVRSKMVTSTKISLLVPASRFLFVYFEKLDNS
jgi:hypothetical protein